jgi:hypothetical protein
MLTCTLILKPLISFLPANHPEVAPRLHRHSKHCSESTVGGTPYESYDPCTPTPPVIRVPLHTIQRSMSTPTSPVASHHPLSQVVPLPEIRPISKTAKVPPRPPPPSDEQRPDLSMFTQMTVIRNFPIVTRLGSVRGKPHVEVGRNQA